MIFLCFCSSAIVLKSQAENDKHEENSEENENSVAAPHQQERPEIVKKRDRALFSFMRNHLNSANKIIEKDNTLVLTKKLLKIVISCLWGSSKNKKRLQRK